MGKASEKKYANMENEIQLELSLSKMCTQKKLISITFKTLIFPKLTDHQYSTCVH